MVEIWQKKVTSRKKSQKRSVWSREIGFLWNIIILPAARTKYSDRFTVATVRHVRHGASWTLMICFSTAMSFLFRGRTFWRHGRINFSTFWSMSFRISTSFSMILYGCWRNRRTIFLLSGTMISPSIIFVGQDRRSCLILRKIIRRRRRLHWM